MKSSNPSLLVAELRAAGLTLSAHGGKLKAGPADLLTDEVRQSIKDRRTEILSILAAESTPAVNTIPATPMQHSAAMAPSRVSCGTCLHFLPDTINPAQGVGHCGVTGAGPPSGGSGYKACYPMAPRTCPSYEGNET